MANGFDTLQATKTLRSAGFDEAQAEAVAVALRNAVSDNVASKPDLREMEARMQVEIAAMESRMQVEIAAARTETANFRADMAERFETLQKHLWAMLFGAVGAISAIVALINFL